MRFIAINVLVDMVEHPSNAIHWHAIHASWRNTAILDMAPKRPDTMCAKQVAEYLVPFLGLFGAHILSFYEWKVV